MGKMGMKRCASEDNACMPISIRTPCMSTHVSTLLLSALLLLFGLPPAHPLMIHGLHVHMYTPLSHCFLSL